MYREIYLTDRQTDRQTDSKGKSVFLRTIKS